MGFFRTIAHKEICYTSPLPRIESGTKRSLYYSPILLLRRRKNSFEGARLEKALKYFLFKNKIYIYEC